MKILSPVLSSSETTIPWRQNGCEATSPSSFSAAIMDAARSRGYERGFPWFILDMFTQYVEEGPDYIHAILNGYEDPPAGVTLPPGANYNKYFPGHSIAMPKPINDGQVEYTDGTPATVDQYGRDVAAFLEWASEPKLDERKRLGFQVFVFLIVFTGLLYFTKKKVWHAVKHDPELLTPRPPTEYNRS